MMGDEGAQVNFHRFGSQGSSIFRNTSTQPYLAPLLTRFNPAMTLMRLFTDGDMIIEMGSHNGERVYKSTTNPTTIPDPTATDATATSTAVTAAGPDTSGTYTYTGTNAYKAFFFDLNNKQPFRGYWMLMDIFSIAIWAGVVLGINKKMKIPLPIVAFAMAIDQLDIIFLALVAYKAVKP